MDTRMESPQSASFVVYYKGVSLTITQRDLTIDMVPLIEKQMANIDYALSKGALPSWNKETNEQISKQTSEVKTEPVRQELKTPCVICGAEATIKTGTKFKNGHSIMWKGVFCNKDRQHVTWL